jgi:hypothetical protein
MTNFADYLIATHVNVQDDNKRKLATLVARSRNEKVAALVDEYANATRNTALYTDEKIVNMHYALCYDMQKLADSNLFSMLCTLDLHVAAKRTTVTKLALSATLMRSLDRKRLDADTQALVFVAKQDDKTQTQTNYCIATLKRMNVLVEDSVTKCFKINADANALKLVRAAMQA